MRYRAWSRAVVGILVALGLGTVPGTDADAQRGFARPGAGRPVRLEGHWDRSRRDPGMIGTLVISPDGARKRTFGVAAAQAYQPPEEGVQIFRASSAQPIALILRGQKDLVTRFMDAKPEERLVAFGLYVPGAAQLVLSSVELSEPPEPDAPD